jgi:poly(3-hydroxybutyrate) depolymerase
MLTLVLASGCSSTNSTAASSSPDGAPAEAGAKDATSNDAGATASPEAGTDARSLGCGVAGAIAGLQTKTTKVGSTERTYQLVVPAAYDPSKALPLVFVFHGLGGDAKQIRYYLDMEDEAAGQALFVYPEGVAQPSQGGLTAWALEDVNFFDAMLNDVSASLCVDRKRVFAAGHSFGAYMSNLVGCERGDVVRGIAPVSGGIVAGACKGPVAVWLAHGDKDATVKQSESITARDHWLKVNGCEATSKPASPGACVSYDGCSPGHPVTWCSFPGGHFPLPAYTEQAIWDFFKAL